jgi:hypothetical protein
VTVVRVVKASWLLAVESLVEQKALGEVSFLVEAVGILFGAG